MKQQDKKNSKTKGRRAKAPARGLEPAGADRLVVRKWGNSAGLRIPMNIMRAAKFEVDQEVDAHVEDGKLIVQPATGRKQTLKEILDRITPENRHDRVDTGAPVGKEVW